jgi:signal transduction histidine kinase/CheY-like chemotaxis protein
VTVLSDSVPLETLSTAGDIASLQRFNNNLVTMDGYVDRQVVRDSNHLEITLIVEGRTVLAQLLLQNDLPVPQLTGSLVRARGVYFARTDPGAAAPRIEIWIQRNEDISLLGTLERDERFKQPAADPLVLRQNLPTSPVHLAGKVAARQPGRSVTLRIGDQDVVLETPQSLAFEPHDDVEAIGIPAIEESRLVLQQSLVRRLRPVFTTVGQLWDLPETEQQHWHQVRIEFLVYHFDPEWRALWGHSGDRDDYLSIGAQSQPIKPGQRILIEGLISPAKGMNVQDARITVLEEGVPLRPISTAGEVGNTLRFNKALVSVEGYVDRQQQADKAHVELDLVVEGRAIIARVLVPKDSTVPKWEGARLRLTGVYSSTVDPSGGPPMIELWTQGLDRVQMLGWLDDDPGFKAPLVTIEKIAAAGSGQMIRLEGTARTQQPGKALTIRDETGQVKVITAQARPVQLGERIEVIGRPEFVDGEWGLSDAIYRRSQVTTTVRHDGEPRLRLADQLRELSPGEAARSHPVQLSGVVTWARPNADFFFIRDVSGGVCVYLPADFTGPLTAGRKVDVTGVSASGKFTPVVLASRVQTTGTVELPEPRRVTLEQALTGIEEAQWVSMSGYVRSVEADGPWTRLELTTSGGEFSALVVPNPRWAKLPGSVVRVRGVCSAVANSKRQLTGIQIWVASARFLEIEEAAPADPFTVPRRPIASLRQFSSLEALNRRVRVSGVVVNQTAGRLLNIQEGADGLLVLSRDKVPLVPGDRIEAVGFPGRESSRLVLREATYRKISGGDQPAPLSIANLDTIDEERDGLLARIDGILVDVGPRENGARLILQKDDVFFEAAIDQPKGELPREWTPGSRLGLTGVYEIQFDEYRRPHSVHLQLRGPGDVRVLKRPSALTVKRILAVTGVLAVCVVLGVGWVLALRRRVRYQTGIIRDQLEKGKAARLDAALAKASKLESVGVLAGGIAHDFNNLLTVVIGNLSVARMNEQLDAETARFLAESEKAALRAKDLTQQLLTFAKGGEPVRSATSLHELVREAAQFGLHGSKVCSEFAIAADLWPALVDKGQIAQVVHNLVINASQAMPSGGSIRIELRNEEIGGGSRTGLAAGRYVRLTLADTGSGISPDHLSRIFEPYFTTKPQGSGLGLATVYSVVKKHEGHIEVHSTVNEGTTFDVWLPAAIRPESVSAPVAAHVPARAGRVLLMDDEASIRQLGSAVVKRMGLDVTAVNDGAAVVDAYATARAAGQPYDLVILDLTVPGGMGGAEAMEKLRAIDQDVRAIVSSGYSSDPVMANHRRYGFSGRVPKPYTASDLVNAVKAVMKPSAA